jgi:glycosyltransferase involved in cell wall biosynthesis
MAAAESTYQPSETSRRTAVVIPVYNEERFIGSVVLQARRYAASVIVVDDGSSDGSAAVADEAGAVVLRHEKNMGKAAAIRTGFRHFKKISRRRNHADVIVMMDGDGQHNAREIPYLAAPILAGEADIVVGSRFLNVKSRISCVCFL